jgi:dihydroorotate dehydrogenase
MFNILRPLIFKFSPEVAHSLAIKALKINNIHYTQPKDNQIIETIFCEKKLPSPIGVAAGFDKNAEVYNPLFNLGFGFVEVGTITPRPQYGNPKPRVFRLEEDEALINRLGFNNSGSEEISKRIKDGHFDWTLFYGK